MKKEEKLNQFWKYVLLIVGGILILVPFVGNGFLVPSRQPRIS